MFLHFGLKLPIRGQISTFLEVLILLTCCSVRLLDLIETLLFLQNIEKNMLGTYYLLALLKSVMLFRACCGRDCNFSVDRCQRFPARDRYCFCPPYCFWEAIPASDYYLPTLASSRGQMSAR